MSAMVERSFVRDLDEDRALSWALAIDALPLLVISAAILVAAERPATMGAVVLAMLVVRFVLVRTILGVRGRAMRVEVAFFAIGTLLGAFNDYNTVVVQQVYDYTVPAELPALSSIPLWMLLTWGFVLRFVASLARWPSIGGDAPNDAIRFFGLRRSAPLRLCVIAVLIIVTRASTFVNASDPILSFVPYLVALLVAAVVLVPTRRDAWLVMLALTIGPLIEALYIRVGGLHRYALGWLFGVPIWIALWWALGAWLWADLARRLHARLVPDDRTKTSLRCP